MKFECSCGYATDDNQEFVKHTMICEVAQDVLHKPKSVMIGGRVAPYTSEVIDALVVAGKYYSRCARAQSVRFF